MGVDSFRFEGTSFRVGPGARRELAGCLEGAGSGEVAVVVGGGAMARQGFLSEILELLPGETTVFSGICSNPQVDQVQELSDFLTARAPRVVVGLGGGSVLDATKAANLAAGTGIQVRALLEKASDRPLQRLSRSILLPTTSGTGSEATPFATIWDRSHGAKYSLDHSRVRATWSLVDPELTRELPLDLTRGTAGDALTHAFEALWARRSTPLSRAHAGEAIRLLREGLTELGPEISPAIRSKLAWGSLLAGMAISTTRTAAAHALSYGLTNGFEVPHGLAVSTLLPEVLRVSWPGFTASLRECLVRAWGGGPELVDELRHFMEENSLGVRLREYGVTREHLPSLAEAADVPGRMDNHAVGLDQEQLTSILEACL